MKTITFNRTFSMGDSGWPLDVQIAVDIEDSETLVHVIGSEDNAPFDNPPLNWGDRINEAIEDHFHPKKVIFL